MNQSLFKQSDFLFFFFFFKLNHFARSATEASLSMFCRESKVCEMKSVAVGVAAGTVVGRPGSLSTAAWAFGYCS